MRTFHSFQLGDRQRLGPIHVMRAQALDFARTYDPQPFFLSDAATRDHPFFERMAVSGWLTCALMMRLLVDDMKENPVAAVGTPGVDRIRWQKPVYPGDDLTLESEVLALRRLKSHPSVGLVAKRLRTHNQSRALVMEAHISEFIACDLAGLHGDWRLPVNSEGG